MIDRVVAPALAGLVTLALLGSVVHADATVTAEPALPPLPPIPASSFARWSGELVVGSLGGILGGAIAVVGTKLSDSGNPSRSIGAGAALRLGLIGTGVGGLLAVGVAAGVTLVGCAGEQTGSFRSTLLWTLGSAGVAGFSFATLVVIGKSSSSIDLLVGGVGLVGLVSAPFFAISGFNKTRRYDAVPPIGSLVQVHGGRAFVGVPIPIHVDATTTLSLASGTF